MQNDANMQINESPVIQRLGSDRHINTKSTDFMPSYASDYATHDQLNNVNISWWTTAIHIHWCFSNFMVTVL